MQLYHGTFLCVAIAFKLLLKAEWRTIEVACVVWIVE